MPRLLFATIGTAIALSACQTMDITNGTIGANVPVAEFESGCTAPAKRASATGVVGGMSVHSVSLCSNGGHSLGEITVKTATNAEGTELTVQIINENGAEIAPTNVGFDPNSQSNWFRISMIVAGQSVGCTIVKPSGGIAPLAQAICV